MTKELDIIFSKELRFIHPIELLFRRLINEAKEEIRKGRHPHSTFWYIGNNYIFEYNRITYYFWIHHTIYNHLEKMNFSKQEILKRIEPIIKEKYKIKIKNYGYDYMSDDLDFLL